MLFVVNCRTFRCAVHFSVENIFCVDTEKCNEAFCIVCLVNEFMRFVDILNISIKIQLYFESGLLVLIEYDNSFCYYDL